MSNVSKKVSIGFALSQRALCYEKFKFIVDLDNESCALNVQERKIHAHKSTVNDILWFANGNHEWMLFLSVKN